MAPGSLSEQLHAISRQLVHDIVQANAVLFESGNNMAGAEAHG
jgi:hypothetical protein